MTPDQQNNKLSVFYRKLREEQAQRRRSRFELVVNRDITPLELPVWYRMGRRGL
jgi:hypothetical protein